MQNPWEIDWSQQSPTTPAAAAPAAPGPMVVGTPKPKEPKDPPSGYRWGAGGSLVPIPGGPADKPDAGTAGDPKVRESEGTASFLATNLAGAMGTIANAVRKNPSAASPTVGNKVARSVLGEWANYVTGPERQQVEGAQRVAIDMALTLGTGAAYNKEQLEGYYQGYIPQIGEGEETVKAKQRAFRLLLQAAKLKAGTAAPKIDEALRAAGFNDTSSFEEDIETALTLPGMTAQARLDLANTLAEQNKRPINQDDAKAAAESGRTQVVTDPSLIEQAGQSLLNVGAGIGEGIVALPDMLAKGAGQVMALGADALGFDNAAEQLRKPFQFGEQIEQAVPVPQGWNDWSARQVARVEGGVLGFPARAGNALAEMVAGKVPPRPPGNALAPNNNQFAADAAALEIQPTVAAAGGPMARIATAGVAQTLGGARAIVQGSQRMVDQGTRALARIAGREGDALNPEAMGERAVSGALKYRTTSRTEIGKVYDEAARIAEDARVLPQKAVAELDKNIADFAQVPGGADGAAYLQSLRDELVNRFSNGVSVQGVRAMRTTLRDKFFKDGLRGTDIERRVNGVVDQLSEDLTTSLIEAGKGRAAELYKQADQAWKIRAETLDDIIMPIIGKRGEKDGVQVAQALQSAAKNGGKRLDRFLRSLPKEEAGDVRASLLASLGKAKAGAQNAEGEAFSFSTLLTNWSQVGPRARRTLFAEGDQIAMDRLARVASRVKDSAKYANYSNTGSTLLTGATGAGFIAEPVMTTLFTVGSYTAGRVLSSPGAARLLLRISTARSPQTAKQMIGQMTALATRNPAAANDILELQANLAKAFQSPATTAAAQEQE